MVREPCRALLLASSMLGALPLAAAAEGAAPNIDWPGYNNDYQARRYSPLDQINVANVASLKEVCRIKIQQGGAFQTGPIVVDGTMYLTTAYDTVALDASNCKEIWRSSHRSQRSDIWPLNRGVAYMNGRLFRGTPDARLLALDAKTGRLLWQDIVGDPAIGEAVPGSPVAWNGVVYTGTGLGDLGIRGRVMAFSAEDGRELWRFNLIPTGDEPGADSWRVKNSALTGGGGTWSSFALDVSRDELVAPVGNPAPDLDVDYRPGDNLYTNSAVVLDARTGALKWYHQLDPHNGLDWDIGASPMLFRGPNAQDIMVVGSKDGTLTAIDRDTHTVLYRTPVTTVDSKPAVPTKQGVHVCPGALGGVEWNGPAYDPGTNSIYVGAVDWCFVVKKEPARYVAGAAFYGGQFLPDPAGSASGWITSIDASTGGVNWKFHAPAPVVGGVTPTAGGVVFGGDTKGNFYALDSGSGQVLFTQPTQGMIAGGVVTYAVGGKQYVAFTSGNVSRITFGELGAPTLIVMAVDQAPPKEAKAD